MTRQKPTAVSNENSYASPTEAQIGYATSLAVQAGYPKSYALSAARRDMNGKNRISAMKRQECSDLIEYLKAKVEG